jgi:hypothetical protein
MMVVAVGITSEEVRSLSGTVARGPRRLPGLMKCLVVSGDEGLRHRLDTMADLSGWSACEAPADAAELRSVVEGDFHLVIAEEFAGRPGTLVVVCGSGDSVDEELWARQLGAWVYLPGVSGGDALMALFSEARRVAERKGSYQFV